MIEAEKEGAKQESEERGEKNFVKLANLNDSKVLNEGVVGDDRGAAAGNEEQKEEAPLPNAAVN